MMELGLDAVSGIEQPGLSAWAHAAPDGCVVVGLRRMYEVSGGALDRS